MACFDSLPHQTLTQRTGLPSNHTQPIVSFRRYQWNPWRLRQANAFYSYRARIESKNINTITMVSLNGSQPGISAMRPGIPSRSMESKRNKDAPVKEAAPIAGGEDNSVNKEESATGMFPPTSSLTAQAIPIIPRPHIRQRNESTPQQNPHFPYPNPRNVYGLSAFKLKIIELTCLERDTIRSEESRKRIFSNCKPTVGANTPSSHSNRQSNPLSTAIQKGRPKSANGNRPSSTNNAPIRPKSAASTRSIKQRSSSSTTELIAKPTNRSLLPTRSKSCMDVINSIKPTGQSAGVEGCELPTSNTPLTNEESTLASTNCHTSRENLSDLPKPVSHSLEVLEEFLEGRSTVLEHHYMESSTSSESDRAVLCKEQYQVHKSNQEEDILVLEHSAPSTPCMEESQTCDGSVTPISPSPPPTETKSTNRDAIYSQKLPKTKATRRQRKMSSESNKQKPDEWTHSKSDTCLASKSVTHSKTSGKSTKKSKLKKRHRRTT